MKNNKFLSLASALLLASSTGFISCSSDSDVSGNNSEGNTEAVKTQFAINIPRAAGNNSSRATAEETQGDGTTFLGIKNIKLLSFDENPTANSTSTATITGLEDIAAFDETNSENEKRESSKVYQNVNINVGTSHFVFYGFANINDSKIGTFDDVATLESRTKLSDISFALKPIANNIDYKSGEAEKIITALNTIDQKWKDTDTDMENAHKEFRKLSAGSANSVRAMFQDILDLIKVKYEKVPDAITQFTASIKALEGFDVDTEGNVTTDYKFPGNLGLPDGAVTLTYTEGTDGANGTFSYKEQTPLGAMNIDPKSITYPALLSYYANSPIHTNTSRVNTWPTNTSNWTAENSFSGWTKNSKVESSTAAIALANNINYGVASLELKVKCKNNELSQNQEGTITVPTDGFEVTGLLIGNQPSSVGYSFAPKDGETFSKTIYDSKVNLHAKNGEESEANYTIVLPNMNSTASEQASIMFALELKNNSGSAFKGYDGMVEKDAKFYLVGTLNPTETGTGVTNETGISKPSVFMSDCQTKVTASISSLQNAYNCIPDIRTTNMQLGLSVDLTWEKGLKFDVEIGGN